MDEKRVREELDNLVKIAKDQDNKLNINMVYMTIGTGKMELNDLIAYFDEKGIELIYDDIEPEVTAYSCEGEKIRPFDPAKISITMKPMTLDALIDRIENKEIEFNTPFQRRPGLWDEKQKSQLIESIFLRIPLPAFYFDASDDDNWVIIDGLQRVSALNEFVVQKKLKLRELEFFPELDGMDYTRLPRTFQRRINETVINVYLVNPSTPDNVKFNIFKRINTGGLNLEPQEIRNALYQGQATEFLNKCSKFECFKKATSNSIKSERMLDREFVLRFVSFCYLALEKYNGNIDDFLNEGMKYLNHIDKSEIEKMEEDFKFVMKAVYMIMGKNSFRKIAPDGRRRPINKVIFESWCYVIRKLKREDVTKLIENKERLKYDYMNLCGENDYLYWLKSTDKKSLYMRIDIIKKLVESYL